MVSHPMNTTTLIDKYSSTQLSQRLHTLLVKTIFWGVVSLFFSTSLPAQTPSPALPTPYYWAIPEHSQLQILTNIDVHFYNHHGTTLDELKQECLTYPQHMQAILLNATQSTIACAESWLQPLKPLGRCGQPAGFIQHALFWDAHHSNRLPHWASLWDVTNIPGHRAFFQGPRSTLEAALLAAGVPPADIYKTLSTPHGLRKAFHILDQIRPYIVWWRTPAQAYHLLEKHTVLMGVAPASVIFKLQEQYHQPSHFKIQENAILYSSAVWGIPATLPPEPTQKTKEILRHSPPHLPNLPQPMPSESLEISDNFWATHELALTTRFNAWLSHPPSSHSKAEPLQHDQ